MEPDVTWESDSLTGTMDALPERALATLSAPDIVTAGLCMVGASIAEPRYCTDHQLRGILCPTLCRRGYKRARAVRYLL
jgi:hypothetical protein